MEACPKIPMLSFDIKICNYEDGKETAEKIFNYIYSHYQENPESFKKEIGELMVLKESAVNAARDFMGLNILKKYHEQLKFLSNRFPMLPGGECETEFSWDDLYNQRELSHMDIRFEQACILYNIGALHSYLGCVDSRKNDDGIKISCTHFQYASWAFKSIRETYSGYDFSSDLNEDIATFKMNVMLAQAQECVLEKSITDNRKTSINAKIGAQIIEFYQLALTNIEKPEIQKDIDSKVRKDWKHYCQFKINYYKAISHYYSAIASTEQQKYGEAVGYIQVAESNISECKKMKNFKELQDPLKFTVEFIDTKLKLIKKDNDFVYNEKIISPENLAEVKGVSLVKCLPVDFTGIESKDIFGRLVSIKAHELSSLYSEEKAKLLRQMNDQVDDKNSQLNQFITALQINKLHLNDFDYLKLPKELLECCASLSVRPTLMKEEIPKSMKSIVSVSVQAKEILDDIEETIEFDEKEYRQMNYENGHQTDDSLSSDSSDDEDSDSRKNVSSRKVKLKEISKQYDLLQKNFNDANSSNSSLHEAFNSILKNLQVLSLPLADLSENLPDIGAINNEESKEIRDKLVSLLEKVEEMKTQREELVKRFHSAIQDDDLTRTISSQQNEISEPTDFFQTQMKKHEQLVTYLQQNLQAQDNILRALGDANALFTTDRQMILNASQQRNAFIDGLVFSYQSVNELTEKAHNGVIFFEKLIVQLKLLLKDVHEFCSKQKEERENKKRFNQNSNSQIQQPARFNSGSSNFPNKMNSQNDAQQINMNTNNMMREGMNLNSERPKLKDFLPHMKPQSWGAGKNENSTTNRPRNFGPPTVDRSNFGPPTIDRSNFGLKPNIPQQPQHFNQNQAMPSGPSMPPNNQVNQQMPVNQANQPMPVMPSNNQAYQQMPGIHPNNQVNRQIPGGQGVHPNNQINQQVPGGHGIPPNTQIDRPMPGMPHNNYNFHLQNPQSFIPNVNNERLYQFTDPNLQQKNDPQEKLLQQKILDQLLKEKEFDLKRQELEQKEQQLKVQQQDFILQQQKQQQQFLIDQEKQQRMQQNQKMQQQLEIQKQQQQQMQMQHQQQMQYSNNPRHNLHSSQNQLPNSQSITPSQLSNPQLQMQNNIPNQINSYPKVNQQNSHPSHSFKSQNSSESESVKPDLLNNSNPESVYKPGSFNQFLVDPNKNLMFQNTNINQNLNSATNNNPILNNKSNYDNNMINKTQEKQQNHLNINLQQKIVNPSIIQQPQSNYTNNDYNKSNFSNTNNTQLNNRLPSSNFQNNNASNNKVENYPKSIQNKPSAIDDLLEIFDGSNLNTQVLLPTQQTNNDLNLSNSMNSSNLSNISNNSVETSSTITTVTTNNIPATNSIYEIIKAEDLKKSQEIKDSKPLVKSYEEDQSKTQILENQQTSKPSSSPSPSLAYNKLNFLNNPIKLDHFLNEVRKLENHVNSLSNKTLASCTLLEKEWKELNDFQEKNFANLTISVARCYPDKNRFQDLLPFDQTRICLQNKNNDDYINATRIGKLMINETNDMKASQRQPDFIIAQAPILVNPSDLFNFWIMMIQQQVELICCLCRDSELFAGIGSNTKNSIPSNPSTYWPIDKETPLIISSLKITLLSIKETINSTKRICLVTNLSDTTQKARTVVLLQQKYAPNTTINLAQSSGIGLNEMPENLAGFLKFIKECEHFYTQDQRNSENPILVHCMNGVSRSAVFLAIYGMIQIIDMNCEDSLIHQIPTFSDSLIRLIKQMRTKRKYMIQSTYHLKYSYDAVLYYLKDILIKQGVLTNLTSKAFETKRLSDTDINPRNFLRQQSTDSNILSIQDSIQTPTAVKDTEIKGDNFKTLDSDENFELINNSESNIDPQISPANTKNEEILKKTSSMIENMSLEDLCNPTKFTLGLKEDPTKRKQKITKNDFFKGSSNLSTNMVRNSESDSDNKTDDPFSLLDPLRKTMI